VQVRDDFVLTEKQRAFALASNDPKAKEILFGGAIRSGKSQVAARILVGWAMQKPGVYAACRATYRELEDSTKRIFLQGDGALPPAVPHEIIADSGRAIFKQDQKVILTNGSEILFRSLEETEKGKAKFRNITLSGAFIDQLEEFDSDMAQALYQEILSRLSHPLGPRKMIAAANPGPETHWAYERFVDPETRRQYPDTRYVHVEMSDNVSPLDGQSHLPDDYVAWAYKQEETNPDFFRRFVLGQWGAFGGKRFKSFHRDSHVVPPFQVPSEWEVLEGIDYGIANPFAVVWVAVDWDGRWWVVAEHHEAEQPLAYHAGRIREIREQLNLSPSYTFIDPSTFNRTRQEFESVAFELQTLGIQVGRAQNERIGGWARLDELMLERLDDGQPRLVIMDRCTNLLKELPNARFKEGSDDIEKENDHALDALRYVVMTRPPSPVKKKPVLEPREERIENMMRRLNDRGANDALVF
jgi:phage terminase large subunit